jgi:hypothetical protein
MGVHAVHALLLAPDNLYGLSAWRRLRDAHRVVVLHIADDRRTWHGGCLLAPLMSESGFTGLKDYQD